MRLLIAALLVALPVLVDAQSSPDQGQSARASGPRPSAGVLLAPLGLPLPDITPALAPLGLPAASATPPAGGRMERDVRHHAGARRSGRGTSGVIYVVPAYLPQYGPLPAQPAPQPPVTADAIPVPAGTLWLDVEPPGLGEMYLDGALVGTMLDIGRALALEAGRHRVEIRANGYRPIDVDVRVDAGGAVTLRRTLQPEAPPTPPATAPSAPITRKAFYFVPGCYLGDVPPAEAGLPAHCDLTKTVVVRP